MQFNRPKAKICFKSDSNLLLIDFFDPISAVQLNRPNVSIRIRTQISNPNSIYIKNWSNSIENGWKQTDFIVFCVIIDKNQLFWLL